MLQKHGGLPCLPTLPLAQLAATPPTLYKISIVLVEGADDVDWLLCPICVVKKLIGQDLTKSCPRWDKIVCSVLLEIEELYLVDIVQLHTNCG